MRLIGYVRVSTQEQAREGISLSMQADAIRAWCVAMGYECVDILRDEGVSAKSLSREGLQQALAMLVAGEVDGLVVMKMDRLTRSIEDYERLVREFDAAGWSLSAIRDSHDTSTANGRAQARMMVVFSQLERELAGERTKDALQAMLAAGETLGPPRLGRLPGGEWRSAEWQNMWEEARYLRDRGASLQDIAEQLPARPDGRVWNKQSVSRILQ